MLFHPFLLNEATVYITLNHVFRGENQSQSEVTTDIFMSVFVFFGINSFF